MRWRWKRLKVFLAHLLPRTHWGVYSTDCGQRRFLIWKQWGLKVSAFEQFQLTGWDMNRDQVPYDQEADHG